MNVSLYLIDGINNILEYTANQNEGNFYYLLKLNSQLHLIFRVQFINLLEM